MNDGSQHLDPGQTGQGRDGSLPEIQKFLNLKFVEIRFSLALWARTLTGIRLGSSALARRSLVWKARLRTSA